MRIHLVVAVHHDDDVKPVGEGPAVAGDGRGADTAPALVREHLDARVAELERPFPRAVGGAVVDDEDPVDERRDSAERRGDQRLLVVRGHDDPHALALEHPERLTTRRYAA